MGIKKLKLEVMCIEEPIVELPFDKEVGVI